MYAVEILAESRDPSSPSSLPSFLLRSHENHILLASQVNEDWLPRFRTNATNSTPLKVLNPLSTPRRDTNTRRLHRERWYRSSLGTGKPSDGADVHLVYLLMVVPLN